MTGECKRGGYEIKLLELGWRDYRCSRPQIKRVWARPLLIVMLCSLARSFPLTVHIPTTLNQGGGGGRGLIINGYRHISGEHIWNAEGYLRGNLRCADITSSGGGGSCNTPYHSTRLKLSQAPGGEATYHAADFTSAPWPALSVNVRRIFETL